MILGTVPNIFTVLFGTPTDHGPKDKNMTAVNGGNTFRALKFQKNLLTLNWILSMVLKGILTGSTIVYGRCGKSYKVNLEDSSIHHKKPLLVSFIITKNKLARIERIHPNTKNA